MPLQFPKGINFQQQWEICLNGLSQTLKHCCMLYKIQSLTQETIKSDNFFMEKDMGLLFSLFYISFPGNKKELRQKIIKAITQCQHKTWTLEFLNKCEKQIEQLQQIENKISHYESKWEEKYGSLNLSKSAIEEWRSFLEQAQKFMSQSNKLDTSHIPSHNEIQKKMVKFLEETIKKPYEIYDFNDSEKSSSKQSSQLDDDSDSGHIPLFIDHQEIPTRALNYSEKSKRMQKM